MGPVESLERRCPGYKSESERENDSTHGLPLEDVSYRHGGELG